MTHWNWQQWEAALFLTVWVAVSAFLVVRKVTDWFGHRHPQMSREAAAVDALRRTWERRP